MGAVKILSKPVKQPGGYWHMNVEIDGKEEVIKDLSPAACREQLKFRQTGFALVEGTVEEDKEYPLLGQIISEYLDDRIADMATRMNEDDIDKAFCRVTSAERILFLEECDLPINEVNYQGLIEYEVQKGVKGYTIQINQVGGFAYVLFLISSCRASRNGCASERPFSMASR